jgi:hypothetical protein
MTHPISSPPPFNVFSPKSVLVVLLCDGTVKEFEDWEPELLDRIGKLCLLDPQVKMYQVVRR